MRARDDVSIRLAVQSDASAVARISAAAYIPAYEAIIGAVPKPAYEDYGDRIARGEVWIIQRHGVDRGLAVLESRSDHILVYSIAVDPPSQGRGYGERLLDFAAQRATDIRVSEVRLYTNIKMEKNLRLYRRCGFHEIGTRPHPNRPGELLMDMVKVVSSEHRSLD